MMNMASIRNIHVITSCHWQYTYYIPPHLTSDYTILINVTEWCIMFNNTRTSLTTVLFSIISTEGHLYKSHRKIHFRLKDKPRT